ncbi:Gfo/Idh/MocA family protein [Pseudahrensia aquimaris]|uniref:Gfo/Idh/MocA family protein n=1 Tax=Pseudahrensia aquimaris TaxID=744461 RepID=A0ABW3FKW3_9HYPH
MSGPLKVCCIGAGYFGLFHRDAWTRINGAELVACCDNDIEQARKAQVPAYDDVDAMVRETSPDIVDIITPPDTHFGLIEKLIHAGVKTIICQKPFCVSGAQARQAAELAQQSGVRLIVHENFRFQPWFRAMKTVLHDGRLGEVQNFTFRLRTGDGQGPDAYLERQPYFQTMERFLIHETAIHYIDVFRFLFGEPTSIYADLRKLNPALAGEDAGHFIFGFENGMRAVFDGNRHLDHASHNTRLTFGEALLEGTKGCVRLSGDGSLVLRSFGAMEETMLLKPQIWTGFAGNSVHALQSHVVECVLRGETPENTAREYQANLELEEAIYRSDESGMRIKL